MQGTARRLDIQTISQVLHKRGVEGLVICDSLKSRFRSFAQCVLWQMPKDEVNESDAVEWSEVRSPNARRHRHLRLSQSGGGGCEVMKRRTCTVTSVGQAVRQLVGEGITGSVQHNVGVAVDSHERRRGELSCQ